ncbi:(2Fe-2S)-binding protein [Blastococcus tunisiensis]|uniref:Carbon-monoxide dehydrogenase small subunit n=1 Tax=Blastococcus tunisiensis TaxID=1798228 RepID=A0A1I2MYP0_9ACTN|nr:(2Fe-2S)-binding protein [Blastococcus sp. DSM 46838]SFF94436.1 carbon-monoxide dehydrogenase small subunit [Blastococcus sp. DSM 46838]
MSTDHATNRSQAAADDAAVPGRSIELTVNGAPRRVTISDRDLLVDVVRGQLNLIGTKVGCYNGDCGACTLKVDGQIKKSCVVLAASVDGSSITTIEGVAGPDGALDEVQQAFWDNDAFQCGFCLPGHLFATRDLLDADPDPTEQDVRDALVGNLCRCTGYVNLVNAAMDAAERRRSNGSACPRRAGDTEGPQPADACTLHH